MNRPDSRDLSPAAANRAAPPALDWGQVPFEVGCARCGYDLRGLAEPRCPACGLEFEWFDAVPIEQLTCRHCGYHLYGLRETRCPECGEWFAWEDVLDEYRRRKKPLFEYRWREKPIRSLIRTWFWTLRPGRLWLRMDIHDPPSVGPLLLMVLVGLLAVLLALLVSDGTLAWLLNSRWGGSYVGGVGWTCVYNPAELPMFIWESFGNADVYLVMESIAAWLLCSLAALLVFRQSMRRYKVRTKHVLRVWAYALPFHLGTAVVLISLLYGLELFGLLRRASTLQLIVPLCVVGYVIWSIRCGYAKYLRMPHSSAVAMTSQFMALLGALSLFTAVGQKSFAGFLIMQLFEWIGIW